MGDFYAELEPFADFAEFTRPEVYRRAPQDWLVVITDVRGSTAAIKAGQYKWVNMAGATTIAALANLLGTTSFPFVFGGDGATALVPPERRAEIERVLGVARQHVRHAYGLDLATGLIPHRELIEAGAPISVARFVLKGGPSIAFFSGDGLTMAEKWVKSGRGALPDAAPAEADEAALKGLSCRWAPLHSARGTMLSILVRPRGKGALGLETLKQLIRQLQAIVDLEAPEANPIKSSMLRAERYWRAALAEAKLQSGGVVSPLRLLKIGFEMALVRVLRALGVPLGKTDVRRYVDSMATHSDFRKFDETLRMVIDCSPQMESAIRELLERERAAGTVFYGLHASATALMTCFLERFEDGAHVHFVDGNDGGYAMAATQLKGQMAAAVNAARAP
ncbi:MAG: DUF3095 family protein [Deltaproteobacteria bacterium]|nr:DUF3095 family protein [Deltaproteobacteria bacterium]